MYRMYIILSLKRKPGVPHEVGACGSPDSPVGGVFAYKACILRYPYVAPESEPEGLSICPRFPLSVPGP